MFRHYTLKTKLLRGLKHKLTLKIVDFPVPEGPVMTIGRILFAAILIRAQTKFIGINFENQSQKSDRKYLQETCPAPVFFSFNGMRAHFIQSVVFTGQISQRRGNLRQLQICFEISENKYSKARRN